MKTIKKLLAILIVFFSLPFVANAEKDSITNKVDIYLFHASYCPHCNAEIKYLEQLEKEYDNLNIYKYEIQDSDNYELMKLVKNRLGISGNGVPFTIIGEKVLLGYSADDTTGATIKDLIDYYSSNVHRDVADEIITTSNLQGSISDPQDLSIIYDGNKETPDDSKTTEIIKDVPFFGDVNAKEISLPLLGVVLGTIDGFNPCAMWVLLFLISMLIGMKNRKRMWAIGLTFLGTSALVYALFMVAWLNVVLEFISARPIMILIGLVAIIGGAINLRSYYKSLKDDGCHVIKETKRNKIFARIKKFTGQKSLILALLGAMALAFSVNVVELACTAGIPLMYTQILAINDLSVLETAIYIIIYILFFLIDDIIVFAIAMKTLSVTGITTKYNKYSHLVGGILMLIIGLLLLFKPELLMFGF